MDRINPSVPAHPHPHPRPRLPSPTPAALSFWDDDERGPARALPLLAPADDDPYARGGNIFKEILESIEAMGRERMWDEVSYCPHPWTPTAAGDVSSDDGWSDLESTCDLHVPEDIETGTPTQAAGVVQPTAESTVPPDSLLYPAISKFAYL